MIPQSKGKMYLASERGHTETDWFRSYNTFQFGNYQHPDKTPFGPLYVLNNDTLGGDKKISLTVEETSEIILIPTVGAVVYINSQGDEIKVEVGNTYRTIAASGTTITFQNPYKDDLINFLHLWLKKERSAELPYPHITDFDLEKSSNKLVELFPLYPETGAKAFIGKFSGREEIAFNLPEEKSLFFYVIEGAFEVQYRLLEAGDSLALWDTPTAEIEALSNEAIILIIELPTP